MTDSKKKYLKALLNIFIYIFVIAVVIVFVPKLIVFFMPFVIGWIISAIANYPVRFLEEKIKFKRKATSAIVIILVIGLIVLAGYGIVAFLIDQGSGFVSSIPKKWPEWEESINSWGRKLSNLTKDLPENIRESFSSFGKTVETYLSNKVSSLGTPTWTAISNIAKSVPATIIAAFMCVLSAYFFTVEHNSLSENIEKKAPKMVYSRYKTIIRGFKRALGGYLKAQIIIDFWIYIIILIGFLIMRIDYAAIIALGIAILDFLPFFGTGAAMWPWAIISAINGEYPIAIGMMVTWAVGQVVRQIIQPKIVGDSVGLDPLPTLFLLYIGYHVGSVAGMILAIPIGIIVVSLYKEGLFDNLVLSLKILWRGMNRFREIKKEDI